MKFLAMSLIAVAVFVASDAEARNCSIVNGVRVCSDGPNRPNPPPDRPRPPVDRPRPPVDRPRPPVDRPRPPVDRPRPPVDRPRPPVDRPRPPVDRPRPPIDRPRPPVDRPRPPVDRPRPPVDRPRPPIDRPRPPVDRPRPPIDRPHHPPRRPIYRPYPPRYRPYPPIWDRPIYNPPPVYNPPPRPLPPVRSGWDYYEVRELSQEIIERTQDLKNRVEFELSYDSGVDYSDLNWAIRQLELLEREAELLQRELLRDRYSRIGTSREFRALEEQYLEAREDVLRLPLTEGIWIDLQQLDDAVSDLAWYYH